MGQQNNGQAPASMSAMTAMAAQGLYDQSSEAKVPLGTRVNLADGRTFVYGQAGASNLARAKVNQSQAISANWDNCAVAAASAVGSQEISVTFGGAVTANLFAGGFLFINDADGEGQIFTVKSHPAGTTGVVIQVYEPVRVALTTSSEASAYPNPSKGLIVAPTTLTGALHGVALIDVTADYYAWFQVKGPAPVLVAATLAVKDSVEVATAAGGVIPTAETTFGPVVGTVIMANAATEYALINLDIPGF